LTERSRPNASATASAPDLFRTPSLRNRRVCTFSTVFGAIPSARAVCRMEWPWDMDDRMSLSLEVSSGNPTGPVAWSSHLTRAAPSSGRIGLESTTRYPWLTIRSTARK